MTSKGELGFFVFNVICFNILNSKTDIWLFFIFLSRVGNRQISCQSINFSRKKFLTLNECSFLLKILFLIKDGCFHKQVAFIQRNITLNLFIIYYNSSFIFLRLRVKGDIFNIVNISWIKLNLRNCETVPLNGFLSLRDLKTKTSYIWILRSFKYMINLF